MKTEKKSIQELIDHWTGDEHAGSFGDWAAAQGYTHAIKEVPEDGLYLAQYDIGCAVCVVAIEKGRVEGASFNNGSFQPYDGALARPSGWHIIKKIDLDELAKENAKPKLSNQHGAKPKPGETWQVKFEGCWYAGYLDHSNEWDLAGDGIDIPSKEIQQIGERIIFPDEEVGSEK